MKVKPAKEGRVRRRAVTIAIYAASWLALTLLAPLWLVLLFVVGVFRRQSFVVLRLFAFAWLYFGLELIALLFVAAVFIASADRESRDARLYRLQAEWANANLRAAQLLLGLEFDIEGADCAVPGPSILLIRHASILDTLLPCTFVQRTHGFRVRYVLKQELLFDPCIDIVGNALPNYFVDRTGDTQAELDGVRSMASDLGSDGVLIFPEGTRFSWKKRERALARIDAERPELASAAHALTHVLPPKPGGFLTLLEALPGVDCVFFAHRGLETFADIKSLLSGEVVGSRVRVALWRVHAHDIPEEEADRVRWLYEQWARVNAFVRGDAS